MKQGRSSYTEAQKKVEPKPRVVNPGGADQYGQHMTKASQATPVFGGAGFKKVSPPAQAAGPGGGRTVHRSGSQGKH